MKYIIVFLFFAFFLKACIKEECQIAGGYYEFEIPATLVPAKDTFTIGDTITIVSAFSDEVYERETDKWYKLENFKFFPGTEIKKIDKNPAIEGLTSFEVVVDSITNYNIKSFSGGKLRLKGEYTYNGGDYYLKFILIPNVSGLYYIEQTVYPDLDSSQDFEGKCSNLRIDGAVKMNNGADNNIEMLNDSPDPHYNDWILQKPEERFHKFGGYCFYVKE